MNLSVERCVLNAFKHAYFVHQVQVLCRGHLSTRIVSIWAFARYPQSVVYGHLLFKQNSDCKGDSKVKKGPLKPLKILEEDDEDLSALKDPSEKVSISLTIVVS